MQGSTGKFKILDKEIGPNSPIYFIADIAANHDGDLERAKRLIELAAKSGASAVKFQHFRAPFIVSRRGFEELGTKLAHQAIWRKSVFEVYEEASLPWEWTRDLAKTASDNGVAFFTAPYDLEAVDYVDEYVPAFKVGSGDITWLDAIRRMASKNKPIFLATGASSLEDVKRAISVIEEVGNHYCVMQCNTNYSGSKENRKFANLKVISKYKSEFPNAVLGLSDHTIDNLTSLGSVALGVCAIEKHFTDDRKRRGPDHYFSLDPSLWRHMVDEIEALRVALGDGEKKIEENEQESSIVQRRALRFARSLKKGERIQKKDLIALRPCPVKGFAPYRIDEIIGKILTNDVQIDQLVEDSLLQK